MILLFSASDGLPPMNVVEHDHFVFSTPSQNTIRSQLGKISNSQQPGKSQQTQKWTWNFSQKEKRTFFSPISTKVKNLIEKAKVILWFLAFEITVGTSEIILDGKSFPIHLKFN